MFRATVKLTTLSVCAVVCRAAVLLQSAAEPPAPQDPKLRVDLQLSGERYCGGDVDGGWLQLRFVVRFVNVGSQPVILYRGAGDVSEMLAARSIGAVEGPKPEYRIFITHYISGTWRPTSERPGPTVAILQPGKHFQVQETVPIRFSRNASSSKYLESGGYFIRVVTDTWPYSPELGTEQRKRWRQWGYLWTEPIQSTPARIQLDAKHKMKANCE